MGYTSLYLGESVPANGVPGDIRKYISASPGYLAWVDTKGQEMGPTTIFTPWDGAA